MNRESKAILSAYREASRQGIRCALATVVHIEGSAYRRAGARMLVDERGNMTGAISGGCLEGDALTKALHAMAQGKNKLITYDTSDENDAAVGVQLGCEGLIRVLFEPLPFPGNGQNPDHALELLRRAGESGQAAVIISIFSLNRHEEQPGTCLYFTGEDEEFSCFPVPAPVQRALLAEAAEVLKIGQSLFGEFQWGDKSMQAFIEFVPAPKKLVIVGAGNDARVLAGMADMLDWDVVVADGRPAQANAGRFFPSCQVVVSKPEKILDHIKVNNRTFFVLMTHNFPYDLAVLKRLLTIPAISYIGILGPKKKFARMLMALEEAGLTVSQEQLKKIYAPVGLEIGAETPAEIALSMLAEMSAVMSKTGGGHLRDKSGPIHETKENGFREIMVL